MVFFAAKKIDGMDYTIPDVIESGSTEDESMLFEVVSLDAILDNLVYEEDEYDTTNNILHSISINTLFEDEDEFDESKLVLPTIDHTKRFTTVIKDIFEAKNINDELEKVDRDDALYFTNKQIEDLVEENKGLVFQCAKKFNTDLETKEELICVGMGALAKGLTAFNKTRENKLSTFLVPCIRNAMINFLVSYTKDPINEAVSIYSSSDDTESRESLLEVYALQNHEFSPSAEELVLSKERVKQIRNCLNILSSIERFVIEHLFGINECDIYTQKELGEIIGIAQPSVSQIKQKAFAKLRKVISTLMKNGSW